MATRKESSNVPIMSDSTKSDVKDLLIGALPLAAIGALIGVACHVGGTFVDAPAQRTKEGGVGGIRAQKDICASYEAIHTDDNICKNIKALVPYTIIHPNWLPVFLDDVNIIYASWFRMSEINREALALIPNYEYYIGPSTGMGRSSTLFDYASSFFGNVTTRITHTVESTKSKMNANGNGKRAQMPANGEAYAAATKRLKQLVEEANDLLNVVSMCRYNVAGYSAEFVGICETFNAYLAQCGIAFFSDPDTYHHKRAKVIVDDQVTLVKHVRQTGRLPYEVEICETPTSASLLKWWTLMHTMSLPTMYHAASQLGWHSVYNPEPRPDDGASTEEDDAHSATGQQAGVRYRATNKMQQARQLKNARGGVQQVNMDAVNRMQSAREDWNNSSAIEAGHAFVQDAARAREELHQASFGRQTAASSAAATAARDIEQKQQASIKRPSLNSSFSEQGKFWIERLKAEGWRSVVKKPWAGFMPSVDDACFLPKTDLDVAAVKQYLKSILASCDTRITDMFNTNHRVAEIGVKFYRHWHPSLSDEDDELAAHIQTLLAMEEEWDSR